MSARPCGGSSPWITGRRVEESRCFVYDIEAIPPKKRKNLVPDAIPPVKLQNQEVASPLRQAFPSQCLFACQLIGLWGEYKDRTAHECGDDDPQSGLFSSRFHMRGILVIEDPEIARLRGHPLAIVDHLTLTIRIRPGIRPEFREFLLRHEFRHIEIATQWGLLHSREAELRHWWLDLFDGLRFPAFVVWHYAKRPRASR